MKIKLIKRNLISMGKYYIITYIKDITLLKVETNC